MIYNYHTHTPLCGHATGAPREYVESAIENGIKTLGFSDHTPYVFPDNRPIQGMRMRCDQIQEYAQTVRALAKEYAKDIRILLGFEVEYYPDFHPEQMEFLRSVSPDYLILGQHFVGDESFRKHVMSFPADDYALLAYVSQVLAAINTGDFLYVAHPDVAGMHYAEETLQREYRRLCVGAKKRGVPLELNLLGLRDNRPYPSRKFFEIAAEVGNDVVFGVDAHSPQAFFDRTAERKAREMVKELGLHLIEQPLL